MSEDFKVQQFEVDGISLTKLEVPTRVEDSRLTPSEIEIAERLLRDESYEEIATARGTTRSTVASQVQALFEKFDVASTSELIVELARSR